MILEFLILSIVCYLVTKIRCKQNRKYPRGPLGLPIIGNLHQIGERSEQQFMQIAKKYGDIFSLKYGSYNVIVLNNYKDIRDAFSNPAFSGRPVFRRGGNSQPTPRGIGYNTGTSWTEQRQFTAKTLRDFGFGKNTIESIILDEAKELIEVLTKQIGRPLDTSILFNVSAVNALWTIIVGERLPNDNPILKILLKDLLVVSNKSRSANIRFFPWLYTLWKESSCFFKGARDRKKSIQTNHNFMKAFVEQHKSTLEINEASRDFIDEYLKKIARTTDTTSSFYKTEGEKNLLASMRDMFAAGTDTTAKSMSWIFLLLAMNSETQHKLFEEIKNVVGVDRLPSLNDRKLMPFAQAVISEALRFASVTATGVFHSTTEDTVFRDFYIPKDTIVISNLYGAMHDKKVWPNPDAFKPERFLSHDGKTFIKHEAFIPFSCGKRVCLGTSLAQDELFLFVCSLFQTFEVLPDPNGEKLSTEYNGYWILAPKHHTIMIQKRHQ